MFDVISFVAQFERLCDHHATYPPCIGKDSAVEYFATIFGLDLRAIGGIYPPRSVALSMVFEFSGCCCSFHDKYSITYFGVIQRFLAVNVVDYWNR